MPEKIAITAVVYRGQVFVFCRLINKSVLERFLLIMHKQHTLRRSTNLFSRNLPKLCFTEQVLYQTDNSSHQRCSNFNYFLISRKFPFFFFFFLFKKCEKKSPYLILTFFRAIFLKRERWKKILWRNHRFLLQIIGLLFLKRKVKL